MKRKNRTKRAFLWKGLVCIMTCCLLLPFASSAASEGSFGDYLPDVTLPDNALYNGIVVPANWNSTVDFRSGKSATVPYLLTKKEGGYAPEIINIDVGRQLFVDDYLIGMTNLQRTWHKAQLNGPVLRPETTDEVSSGSPGAEMTSGGLWYDMEEQIYKMWYEAGFNKTLAYATSTDGIHWDRPAINRDGSNTLLRSVTVDSTSVWIDYDAPANERYKLMIREPNAVVNAGDYPAKLYVSPNGTSWKLIGNSGLMGDRSTFYYDCFSRNWIFSIRWNANMGWNSQHHTGRARAYHADPDFLTAGTWDEVWTYGVSKTKANLWLRTDGDDPVDMSQEGHKLPELYNFCAIGYESVMFGLYQMWYGPANEIIFETGIPKITELQAAFSRDGYYYDRPVRGVGDAALIPASRTMGTWDYGYLQAATGGLIVYDDEIRIYYSAFSGTYEKDGKVISRGCHHGGAVGYVTLRRDGFASMDGTGVLLTKPLTVTKDVKYLFVNTDASAGSLRAEILDPSGNVVPGFSADDCIPVNVNDCCKMVTWKNGEDLSFLKGKGFRLRFVSDSAELYSFWLADDEEGISGGAVGAGYAGTKSINPDGSKKVNASANPDTEEPGTASAQPGTDTDATGNAGKKGCSSALNAVLLPVMITASATVLFKRRKRRSDI